MELTSFATESLKVMTTEYHIESTGRIGEAPIVTLHCRRSDGSRRSVEVEGFHPHFYTTVEAYNALEEQLLNATGIRHIALPDSELTKRRQLNATIEALDTEYESLEEEQVVRVSTNVPNDVPDLKEWIHEEGYQTFEADVFFTTRFCISNEIYMGIEVPMNEDRVHVDDIEPADAPDVLPKIGIVDIEVLEDGSFPDPIHVPNPVTAITAMDTYGESYKTWVLHSDEWTGTPCVWEHPTAGMDVDIEVVETEGELLNEFWQWVINTDVDMLSGWNSSSNDKGNGFDYPYLINRSFDQNVWSVEDAARDGSTAFVTDSGSAVLNGRTLLDMMQSYMKTQIHEKRSYSLDYIASDELGYGKEDIGDLDNAYYGDPQAFVKYNIRDVEAVAEIEREKNILEIYDHIRSITGSSYNDIADSNIGIIDDLVLREAFDRDIVLPTSTTPDVRYYKGAWVADPVAGLHENVVYPDLSSLYPNLFKDMNLSQETLIGDENDLRNSPYTKDDCHEVYIDPRDEDVKRETDDVQREAIYALKPSVQESFVREIVDELIEMKYEYKSDDYADEAYAAIKRVTNCHVPDTEVLTKSGVKQITDVTVGEEVYSFNPDTNSAEFKEVTNTFAYPDYDEELVSITNTATDFTVTKGHKFVLNRPRHSDDWEEIEAGDLNEWTHYEFPHDWNGIYGDGLDSFEIDNYVDVSYRVEPDAHGQSFRSVADTDVEPVSTGGYIVDELTETVEESGDITVSGGHNHQWIPRTYDADNVIKLTAWVITEGSFYDGSSKTVSIAQERDDYSDEIVDLLEEMNIPFYEGDRSVEIHNSCWYDTLLEWTGEKSDSKHLPEWTDKLDKSQKELLFETLMKGDGDSAEQSYRYSTKSTQLRDDIMGLLVELGRPPKYCKDSGVWRIYTSNSGHSFRMYRDGETVTTDDGVYDVEVADNHTIIAGRNGNFQFTHQSVYGCWGDSNSYGVGFRLYDWRIAEAITLAGRDVIQHTAETFEEYVVEQGYDEAAIIGGDTDSCVCTLPQADGSYQIPDYSAEEIYDYCDEAGLDEYETPMAETLVTAMKAAEHTDDSYEQFMLDRFNITDGNMAVEIESYASKAFFYPKKKRYAQHIRWDEGDLVDEMEVKGFELVRSDSAELTATAQRRVLELLLKSETPKADVSEYLQDVCESFKNGEYELSEIGKPKAINKDPTEYGTSNRRPQPHIRGAKYASAYIDGEDITSGDKPLMFYVSNVHSADIPAVYDADTAEDGDAVDALALTDPTNMPVGATVDREKMLQKVVRDPIEPIIEVMGWSWADITSSGDQSSLSSYM